MLNTENIRRFLKNRIKEIIIIILLLLLGLAGYLLKNSLSKNSLQTEEIIALRNLSQETLRYVNKQNEVISEQKIIITDDQKQLKKYTDSIFALNKKDQRRIKEIKALYREINTISTDTIYIPYLSDSPVVINDSTNYFKDLLESTIRVPKTVKLDSSLFSINATVLKNSLRINSISIIDTISIMVAEKKNGLFKPRTLTIYSKHSNELFNTSYQQSLIYKPKKKNKWIGRLLTLAAGVYLGTQLK